METNFCEIWIKIELHIYKNDFEDVVSKMATILAQPHKKMIQSSNHKEIFHIMTA